MAGDKPTADKSLSSGELSPGMTAGPTASQFGKALSELYGIYEESIDSYRAEIAEWRSIVQNLKRHIHRRDEDVAKLKAKLQDVELGLQESRREVSVLSEKCAKWRTAALELEKFRRSIVFMLKKRNDALDGDDFWSDESRSERTDGSRITYKNHGLHEPSLDNLAFSPRLHRNDAPLGGINELTQSLSDDPTEKSVPALPPLGPSHEIFGQHQDLPVLGFSKASTSHPDPKSQINLHVRMDDGVQREPSAKNHPYLAFMQQAHNGSDSIFNPDHSNSSRASSKPEFLNTISRAEVLREQEFQVVIYCGQGTRLYPLTDKETSPKALLPMVGRPLIHYPLEWIEREGLYDVFILTHKSSYSKLYNYMLKNYVGTLKFEIVVMEEEDAGSLDAIYQLRDRLTRDFIVLSCDLVVTVPFKGMADYFRLNSPLMMTLLSPVSASPEGSSSSGASGGASGALSTANPVSSDVFAIHVGSNTLMTMEQLHQLKEDDRGLSIPLAAFQKFPVFDIVTWMNDNHFYIFRNDIINILVPFYERQHSGKKRNKKLEIFSSLKDEFIPWLLKVQLEFDSVAALAKALKDDVKGGVASSADISSASSGGIRDNEEPDNASGAKFSGLASLRQDPFINELSCVAFNVMETLGDGFALDKNIILKNSPGGLNLICQRANSLSSFVDLNRRIARVQTSNAIASGSSLPGPPSAGTVPPPNPTPSAKIPTSCLIAAKSQVGNDCVLGESCHLGEKSSIKKSILGSCVQIGSHVKLSNCVIFDDVIIEGHCNITNCVIGNNVVIHERATLKDCEIAPNTKVPAEVSLKGEVLVPSSMSYSDSDDQMLDDFV